MLHQGEHAIVEFRGTLSDGREFASTRARGKPLEFVVGSGTMLPDFEYAVMGMEIGESRSIHIPADSAYGMRDESLVIPMPLTSLPNGETLPVGGMLGIETPEGVVRIRIVSIDEKTVTIDCNHELAGHDLNFDITLINVAGKSAVERELHPVGCTCGCNKLKASLEHMA